LTLDAFIFYSAPLEILGPQSEVFVMEMEDPNLEIEKLGECHVPSPLAVGQFVDDEDRVLYTSTRKGGRGLYSSRQDHCPALRWPAPGKLFTSTRQNSSAAL
jgi:hypothetical protein